MLKSKHYSNKEKGKEMNTILMVKCQKVNTILKIILFFYLDT